VAHRRELIQQLAATIKAVAGPVGIAAVGHNQLDQRITVATIQALRLPNLRRFCDQPGALAGLLIDEAHHITARNSYGRLLERLRERWPKLAVVGCTATPYRADGEHMQDVLSRCAFTRSLDDMQSAGWLAPLQWRRVEVEGLRLGGLRSSSLSGERDYAPEELAAATDQESVTAAIVRETAPLLGAVPSLAFAVNVAHSQHLAAAYRGAGVRAAAAWGAMPDRERQDLIGQWRSGHLQLVVNAQLLAEGYDFPELARLVIARPTMSSGAYVQMLGRVTRTAPGKPFALVMDVAGNANVLDHRQVTLPQITGLADASDVEAPMAPGKRRRRPRRLQILDPVGASPFAWNETQDGIYCLSLGKPTACLVPDPEGSGLYWPQVWFADSGPWRRQVLSGEPVPLREAVRHVAYTVKRNSLDPLAGRYRGWRQRPASDAQLDYLQKLAPETGLQAQAEGWDKGSVSDAITVARVERMAPYLLVRPPVGAAVAGR
jgi:hypothetical protein